MFENTIPLFKDYPSIADVDIGVNSEVEERNYQEPIRENLKKILNNLKHPTMDTSHLKKYFFDRRKVEELETPTYVHFDTAGRTEVVSNNPMKRSLLSRDAVDEAKNLFYPFRFENPINSNSLKAAEILSSVNETFSTVEEFMDYFKHGFGFDNIVGITYRHDDFVLINQVRDSLDGQPILYPIDIVNNGDKSFINFQSIKEQLEYVDTASGRIRSGNMYPLSLRVRIEKV